MDRVHKFFTRATMVGQGRLRSEDLIWKVCAREWTDVDAVLGRGAPCADGWLACRALHRPHGRDVGVAGNVPGLELEMTRVSLANA